MWKNISKNRNSIFDGGIRPHNYCLPILKRETHRKYLINAAKSGNPKYFLGTDTAPHFVHDKESDCGCAGIFNASYCLSILTQLFDNEKSLNMLECFVSKNGANHYNLPLNEEKVMLMKSKKKISFKKYLNVGKNKLKIFRPDFSVYWSVLGC